jgi:hypothetical protein
MTGSTAHGAPAELADTLEHVFRFKFAVKVEGWYGAISCA